MKITLELPEDVYADYAESVGALGPAVPTSPGTVASAAQPKDEAELKRLVTEALIRHIAEGVTRARTNRAIMKIQQEASQAQAGILTSIKGLSSS